jgi:RNA polymerase sigma-70 factor (ECF subfamily)
MDEPTRWINESQQVTLTMLYREYETKLCRYASQLTHDADRAEDLVQETFIRAMGHLDLLGLLESYQQRAWLYRTLKNLFFDEQAARQRQHNLVEQLAWDIPAAGYVPQELLSPSPFDLIPERYRELFEKRYVLGMTSQEIGDELGIPAATVRSRLHLALKKLRLQAHKLR